MSFSTKKDKSEQIKQRLNLSSLSYCIIQSDMDVFENKSIENFINRVFLNFANAADASISNSLSCYRSKLEDLLQALLQKNVIDQSSKERIIKILVGDKEKELEEKSNYEKNGNSVLINLNFNVKNYLFDECSENKYYKSCSQYIKNVIEEYVRLPYFERERIYFKNHVDIIEDAIDKNYTLKIASENKIRYEIYPYKLMTDFSLKANYIVGYRKRLNSNENKEICVYRLSRLKNVEKHVEKKNPLISKQDKRKLEDNIKKRGVEFLIGEEQEIKVKMTQKGIYQYSRALNLRPIYKEKSDDNTFVFECTQKQAEFYFFKFGEDIEIIEPLDLRKHFKEKYEKAAEIYKYSKNKDK